jgi:iron complex transport system substrate-binding protein
MLNQTRILGGTLGLVLAAASLVACAPAQENADAAGDSSIPAAEGTTSYPLELPTDFGTTTLEERPERVAVIGGLHDLEAVLALDVIPVMANDPVGWPWLEEAGGDKVEVTFDVWAEDGLPFEEILATRPDVIIATTYGNLETDYEKLASIAPVVAMETYAEAESWQLDWKDVTTVVGEALDLSAAASAVIADSDALVAETAAAHPEWAETTTSIVMNRGEEAGLALVNIADSPAENLLSELGFAPQPYAADLVATDGDVSVEQIEMFDADSIVIAEHGGDGTAEEATAWLEGNQLYQSLSAVRSGHVGFIAPDAQGRLPIAWAFSYPSALAIEYTVGQLEDVYGGILG